MAKYPTNRLTEYWDGLSKRKKYLTFLFLYTGLFLVSFLLVIYAPFREAGKSFIISGDGWDQHYPALAYLGRYLRSVALNLLHGKIEIPMFDFSLAMGGDIITATSPFDTFSDPLNWLAIFVPTKFIEYLYDFLVVIRMYLAGLTFSYLCLYHGKKADVILVGALIYVYGGYMLYSAARHPLMINNFIQLPLLLTGIDLVIKKRSPFVFILSVFYAAICGYYFLYMMTIMLGIYAIVVFFEYYQTKRVKEFAFMAGRIIGSYLLGIGLSAIVFLPMVWAFLSSSRLGASNLQDFGLLGYIGQRAMSLISPQGSFEHASLASIVLPALVIMLLTPKKRRSIKILSFISLVMLAIPLSGYIMNGFQYASGRWTFCIALLLAYVVAEMFPELMQLKKSQKLICCAVLVGYASLVFIVPQLRTVYYVTGTAMLAVTVTVLLFFNDTDFFGSLKLEMRWLIQRGGCIILVIANLTVNGIFLYTSAGADYLKDFTASSGAQTARLEGAVERVAEPYLGNGRFDSTSFYNNGGIVWHVPTMFSYWSATNAGIVELWNETENIAQNMPFRIHGSDQGTIFTTLLSNRYYIDKVNRAQYRPFGYVLCQETKNERLVFQNQYALPWGYTYDKVMSYAAMDGMNGLEKQEAMLQAIALENAESGIAWDAMQFKELTIPYEAEYHNCEWEDGKFVVSGADATITLTFDMPVRVEAYLRLKAFDINDSGRTRFNVTAKCADVQKSATVASQKYSWYFGRENYLFNLGYSEEGRTTCTITFPQKGTFKLGGIEVYALPMDSYPEQVEALRAEPLENIEITANHISGTVDLSKDKVLCMSIPYSRGWSAKVDGRKAEIQRGNYMFMAIPLTEGHHDIELSYCTPGLVAGAGITIISLGIVIGMLVLNNKRKRQEFLEKG